MILTAPLPSAAQAEAGFAATVPAEWGQGRTTYGGFSTALALRAALALGGAELPPLRSALVSFVGPVHGPVTLRARKLRQGRNATWINAEVLCGDDVGLAATFVFMGATNSPLELHRIAPPAGVLAPEDSADIPMRPEFPAFRSLLDVRPALPRELRQNTELCWWVRLQDRAGLDPMTELMLLADALPPGIQTMLKPGVPVSSMTWQANLLTAAPATRDGWWLLRSAGNHAQAGCLSETLTLWNTDGQPIVAGMQAVALFG